MILYINACARTDSRTDRLAKRFLSKFGEYTELRLYELGLQPLSEERLARRMALLEKGALDDPMFALARQFAAADQIVIGAPYWDMSFPSILKVYIENIYITGIVSRFSETGVPVGLCRAKRLTYVTTAGGPYDGTFSFGYIKALAQRALGIPNVDLICAEMLDVWESDVEEILKEAEKRYDI